MENASLLTVSVPKMSYRSRTDHIQLNTSRLGQVALSTSKTSSPILNTIGDDLHKGANKVVADVAKELGIHDFYSAHILDFCEVPSPRSSSVHLKIC